MAGSEFDAFCRQVFDFLDETRASYLVIGGLAVLVVGEPRTTADADVLLFADATRAEGLLESAGRRGFELDPSVERERLRRTGTLRFRRGPFQVDLILASLPFEKVALRRALRKKLFGRMVAFPTPEDLILFKVLAGRPKDLLDAEGVARRHASTLDRRYLEETLRPLCDLAEDLTAWNRLQQVLRTVRPQ